MRSRTVVMAELPEPAGAARFTGEYEENRKQDLREAVENLDETLRIVIHLFYYQDLPIKEVASVLEISEGAVRARLHRARGILADKVKRMGKEELAYGNA